MIDRALLYSLGMCLVGAVLETLFAGRDVRRRIKELRLPRFAPPFRAWIVIGVVYYAICFAVAYRLFGSAPTTSRNAALVLLALFMFVNALWNYFFFRSRNLEHAFRLGLLYSAIALVLFVLLFLRVDRVAAWCFAPYLAYLGYANVWGRRIAQLNASPQ